MNRLWFHLLRTAARVAKALAARTAYMKILTRAHQVHGVVFRGLPRYIDFEALLDPTGGLVIGDNVVISTRVIILTHDYAITAGLASQGKRPARDLAVLNSVVLGDNCFVGAGSIILPGASVGSSVIIGAGSVVKGPLPPNSVAAGNPARPICPIRDWVERKIRENNRLLCDPS